jgi:hypothetical protein
VTEIEPDSKDWTWVLGRPCTECGLDAALLQRADIAPALRASAAGLAAALRRPAAATRPSPSVWSPLEYGAHVRDVFAIYEQRLTLMLEQHDPLFPNWDQDATAVTERYAEQDPAVVAGELERLVQPLASHFEALSDEQWLRPGRRGDGAVFTVDTFAQYLVHDPVHHLWDVTGQAAHA